MIGYINAAAANGLLPTVQEMAAQEQSDASVPYRFSDKERAQAS